MHTKSRDQAESCFAIQFKLDALLRNSITHEKTALEKSEKQSGSRVDFVETKRKK